MTGFRLAAACAVLAAASAPAIAAQGAPEGAKGHKVVLENRSGQDIRNFYVSEIGPHAWEHDMLGDNVLSPGTSLTANIYDGTAECRFNLRVVMANGREFVHRQVDVCATRKWVIGDKADAIG